MILDLISLSSLPTFVICIPKHVELTRHILAVSNLDYYKCFDIFSLIHIYTNSTYIFFNQITSILITIIKSDHHYCCYRTINKGYINNNLKMALQEGITDFQKEVILKFCNPLFIHIQWYIIYRHITNKRTIWWIKKRKKSAPPPPATYYWGTR